MCHACQCVYLNSLGHHSRSSTLSQSFGSAHPPCATLCAGKAIKFLGKFGAKMTRNLGSTDLDTTPAKSMTLPGEGRVFCG